MVFLVIQKKPQSLGGGQLFFGNFIQAGDVLDEPPMRPGAAPNLSGRTINKVDGWRRRQSKEGLVSDRIPQPCERLSWPHQRPARRGQRNLKPGMASHLFAAPQPSGHG